jgi:hypothetical protein
MHYLQEDAPRKEIDLSPQLIGDHLIYLVLYVDDMLMIGNNKEII